MILVVRKYIKDRYIVQHRLQCKLFSTLNNDPTWSEHNRGKKKRFVDRARIRVAAGRGGNGCISFEMFSDSWRRPSGGHGGPGGNVILIADSKVNSLDLGVHHFNASPGTNGGSKNLRGRTGKDMVIRVPCGTVVKKIIRRGMEDDEFYPPNEVVGHEEEEEDPSYEYEEYEEYEEEGGYYDDTEESEQLANELGKEIEGKHVSIEQDAIHQSDTKVDDGADDETEEEGEEHNDSSDDDEYEMYDDEGFCEDIDEEDIFDEIEVADLVREGDHYLAAKGGRPGLGNGMLASSKAKSSTLHHRSAGHFGEDAFLQLELKIIAQVGLVGYPNAGKSSFLGAVSNARPHVAPYPFTTMKPGIGIIEYSDFERVSVADLPGLVDGAHENRGLGHSFLKHVERVGGIIYVIDAAGVDGRSPVEDLTQLILELELYNPTLLEKPALVFANKVDLPSAADGLTELRQLIQNLKEDPSNSEGKGVQGMFEMSMASGKGLEQAVIALRKYLVEIKK